MSKEKAKLKAHRKHERRQREASEKEIRVSLEKSINKAKQEADQKRNKINQEKKLEVERKEESNKPEVKFTDDQFKPIFDDVLQKIGNDHQLALDFALEELDAASRGIGFLSSPTNPVLPWL